MPVLMIPPSVVSAIWLIKVVMALVRLVSMEALVLMAAEGMVRPPLEYGMVSLGLLVLVALEQMRPMAPAEVVAVSVQAQN